MHGWNLLEARVPGISSQLAPLWVRVGSSRSTFGVWLLARETHRDDLGGESVCFSLNRLLGKGKWAPESGAGGAAEHPGALGEDQMALSARLGPLMALLEAEAAIDERVRTGLQGDPQSP